MLAAGYAALGKAIVREAPASVAADPLGADSIREPEEQLDFLFDRVAHSKITLRLIR